MIIEATGLLQENKDLSAAQMRQVMEEIMLGEAFTPQIVSFLAALNKKGETVEEIAAGVEVMRKFATRIRADKDIVLDTCGTGGDKKGTFNVSTAVAFVAAGSGITVAKHGNRSVSSRCGSADILEALGVNIDLSTDRIEACLNKIGLAFLFAQNLHPAMKHAMPARKEIAAKTIFNILGPLSNPAGATHQLVGVYDYRLTQVLAEVLLRLETKSALVVCGKDGLDEITTTDKTFISELKSGKIRNYEISPEDFGLIRCRPEDLKGASAEENADMLTAILRAEPGPKRDIVILNSAAAIYVAGKVDSIKDGIKAASVSIDSGSALKKLELLKEFSRE
ncbi:MAG: anthranilate phosphoribosyltransferase [Candidatus Omnitrophica bacterium]|nr:anthranilate phosphoribosyltransferase [Candidatus Omnitrophota bacterium]